MRRGQPLNADVAITRISVDTGFTEFIRRDQIRIAMVCGYDDWEGILNGMQMVLGEAPDGQTAREKSSEGCAWKALSCDASLSEGMRLRPNPATHDTPTATPVIVSELTPLSGTARGNNGVATLSQQPLAAVRNLRCSTRKLPMCGRRPGK